MNMFFREILNHNLPKLNSQIILFLLPPHWLNVPPLSLIFLKRFLVKKEFKVTILDLNILFYRLLNTSRREWLSLNSKLENEIILRIKNEYPDLISQLIAEISKSPAKILGFSLFSRNRKATFDFIKEIRKAIKSKTLVFGGPEVLFEYYRDSFFSELKPNENTYFVLGEGELPLWNISENIYKKQTFKTKRYKHKNIVIYNELKELDVLPFFDFNSLNLNLYKFQTLPLFSSRGCIKRCAFCSECRLYKKFRQHSPEYILKLIKFLTNKHHIKTFSFADSLINADLNWLNKLCELLIKENLRINWQAQLAVRSDMEKELLDKMKISGCYNLFVGLESASDKILHLMHKGYCSKIAKEFIRKLYSANLHFEISLIVGFPQEDDKEFQKTVNFIKENKIYIPKIAQINPFVEYPPSKINKRQPNLDFLIYNRIETLLKLFKQEKIKYTNAFINNLIYK